ncbi:MAG: DNA polymerase IV [Thaumarchaeota archaeon]|nr:DNA polymerase IV [Nitrososphaerota archaeon]
MSIGSNRVVICVDLDYFYAQSEEVRNPSIKGKPVVVCVFSGRTEISGAVSTSNYVARRLGVRSGMPIALAKKTLARYPDAVFLPMDTDYYDSISSNVMDILRSKSPAFEQSSIDEAYLDVSNETEGDFSRAYELGKKIRAEILEREKLTCSVGIGPNKLVSKMAADSKKPDGLTLVVPGEVQPFLNKLEIGKLFGIGPKTVEKLHELGIGTVVQLAQADIRVLSEHFGEKLGPQLRDAAMGVDDNPVQERGVEQFSRIVTLKRDSNIFDFQDVLEPLAADLSKKLLEYNMLAGSIGIIAITAELKTKTRTRKIENSTDSKAEIVHVASSLFESFFADGNSSHGDLMVRRIGVRVSNLAKPTKDKKEPSLVDFL